MSTESSSYTIQYPKDSIVSEDQKIPYELDERLGKAIEVAITLNMPLLLTGEPGTGKTRLADKIAADLNAAEPAFLPSPLVFHTKTTSSARELFYQYDALRHFHEANLQKGDNKELKTSDYISLQALGEAIALSNPNEIGKSYLDAQYTQARSSVVLIDEIDKAPRDFPNDILAEIERFQFEVKEDKNYRIQKGPEQQIVVVMTSNSEKNLPEAFLRRVIFYHIDFPKTKQLIRIVNAHLNAGKDASDTDPRKQQNIQQLVRHFEQIRGVVRKKKPATAELIAWIRILEMQGILQKDLDINALSRESETWKLLERSYSILAKTQVDLQAILEMDPNI
ncbi:MAG: MoxR family ATPase [Bacteroidota bacterium]